MKILYLPNQYSQQRQREKKVWIYPVLMAMEAEYYRKQGQQVFWGECAEEHDYDKVVSSSEGINFISLPAPDRLWSGAFDKRYQVYGNYKFHPATHMQVSNGCWHGKCVFCVEQKNKYEVRNVYDVMREICECKRLGFREIFDDSGTFPTGKWLNRFCLIKERYFKDIVFGCNMRIGANVDFKMMKSSGFRMVLFGIESANQLTHERIQKGINVNEIIPTLKRAAEAGLEPHGAFMFGFPWESKDEELKTLKLCHYLLRKGYLKTAQVSIYETKEGRGVDRGVSKHLYDVAVYPEFWVNKFRDIKRWEDVLYLLKGIRKGINA